MIFYLRNLLKRKFWAALGSVALGIAPVSCRPVHTVEGQRPIELLFVEASDYAVPIGQGWVFRAGGIVCGIARNVFCLGDPEVGLPGAGLNNVALLGDGVGVFSWADRKPDEMLMLSKTLKAGNAINIPSGYCAVRHVSVVECRRGVHGFLVDPAGSRGY